MKKFGIFITAFLMAAALTACTTKDVSEASIEGQNALVATADAPLETVEITAEDGAKIKTLWEEGTWSQEGTAECINDCVLTIDGTQMRYHSECGTFNDAAQNRHLSLEEDRRVEINDLLEKYIRLGSVDAPMD